jgi:hypothetical protein
MVDIQLFAQAKKIQDALQRHSCKECLQWCSDNRSGLKKSKVSLIYPNVFTHVLILAIIILEYFGIQLETTGTYRACSSRKRNGRN